MTTCKILYWAFMSEDMCPFLSHSGSIMTVMKFTHALPTERSKQVVVVCLHDGLVSFHTGMKFSPRFKNQDELVPVWIAPVWHFLVVPCRQIQSHNGKPGSTHTRGPVLESPGNFSGSKPEFGIKTWREVARVHFVLLTVAFIVLLSKIINCHSWIKTLQT